MDVSVWLDLATFRGVVGGTTPRDEKLRFKVLPFMGLVPFVPLHVYRVLNALSLIAHLVHPHSPILHTYILLAGARSCQEARMHSPLVLLDAAPPPPLIESDTTTHHLLLEETSALVDLGFCSFFPLLPAPQATAAVASYVNESQPIVEGGGGGFRKQERHTVTYTDRYT